MLKTVLSMLLGFLAFTSPALAQDAEELLSPEDLEGSWESAPQAEPGPSGKLEWTAVFAGKFYRLDYRFFAPGSTMESPSFAGIAHYASVPDGPSSAQWIDSNGNMFAIDVTRSSNMIVANWGGSPGPRGRTHYELVEPTKLIVTDFIMRSGEWVQFNRLEMMKVTDQASEASPSNPLVSGIGGIFFRSRDPSSLSQWYTDNFGIAPPPQSLEQTPWRQEAGYTVFGPFEEETDYFDDDSKQWMINFRVHDLDALSQQLRENGIEVSEPVTYPHGRFARMIDPEGNAIELWEPTGPAIAE